MSDIKITKKQGMWLDQQGGRNENDLRASRAGNLYVLMGDGYGNNRKVFIPEDKDLKYKESANSNYLLVERTNDIYEKN